MQTLFKSRYTLLLLVLFLYFVPMMLLSSYGRMYMPFQKGWNLLSFGLLCSIMGTIGVFWMMCRLKDEGRVQREEDFAEIDEPPQKSSNIVELDMTQVKAMEELQEQFAAVQEQLAGAQVDLNEKVHEFEQLQHEYQLLQEKLGSAEATYQNDLQGHFDEVEQQKLLLLDSQRTISEQRESIDKQLQQISQLEIKVSDLTYEIKTLIQLAEIENQTMPIYPASPMEGYGQHYPKDFELEDDIPYLPEKQVKNRPQAEIQLKRCIDIAQKITGANHYNNLNSRFKDFGVDNYTLDLRRLFDSLRAENGSMIIFYSQKENKVLFANNQSRNLLGWSPDKFVQSFQDIVDSSKENWKQGVMSLSIKNDTHLSLKMKSKSGSQEEIQVLLGIIPTGLFKNHILGVLYRSL